MRRHAPMWEAELRGEDNVSDFDIYLRKSLDDAEMLQQTEENNGPSWLRLLVFAAAAAIFLFLALGFSLGG